MSRPRHCPTHWLPLTSDTLSNMKDEVLNNQLPDTPKEEKTETLGDTPGDVKTTLLVDTLSDNLRQVNAEINLAH